MSLERIRRLVARFRERVAQGTGFDDVSPWGEAPELGRELLESMLLARHLDVAAHTLRAAGHGHYTICSTGHEGNVVLGRLTHPSDPALVHYRSAALQLERARQAGVDGVRDIALSLVASADEPTSGGRHKVFGGKPLGIIPQTSTIASHLPRAVGLAFALERRPRLGLRATGPDDAIALVSFGDASVNHSTAQGALNAAGWALQQRLKLPLLFVCEDNGLGISVRTPTGWLGARLRALPNVEYFQADGADLGAAWAGARAAIEFVRQRRRPALLHLSCVRLLGHAGSDVDTVYRSPRELGEVELVDPVTRAAAALVRGEVLTTEQVLELDREAEARVERVAEDAIGRPKLRSRAEVMAALARPVTEAVEVEATRQLSAHGAEKLTLAQGINLALDEALQRYPELLIFGQDVAKKGGVYGLTKGLMAKAGPARVFNTLLDEQTILGLGLGTATLGLLPVPEIQYLAYLHNAEDQLRGEAATMGFFSNGAYDNPMVVRIAGFAYQKGFGGHFHNDNSLAVLRDIPGLVVMVPARGDDGLLLMRTALALAHSARRVVVIVEPIALYHTRDLYAEGDGEWRAAPPAGAAAFGEPRVYHPEARDLVIASYGNGVHMSLVAARRLEREHGLSARVLDLRFIAPLPLQAIAHHALQTERLLVVDECRRTGSVSEAIVAGVAESAPAVTSARVTGADSFIPLGEAANLVLVGVDEIVSAGAKLARR